MFQARVDRWYRAANCGPRITGCCVPGEWCKESGSMTLLRERGAFDQFAYLLSLKLDPEDAGRLDVADATVDHSGFYVEATSGEVRLLSEGDRTPDGIWIAQRDLDSLREGLPNLDEPHGFGEGFGAQGLQFGGDRSYPEEDSGGTRR